MAISLLPSLSRSDPAFKSDVDTFFGTQLPNFTSEINTEIDRINQIGFGSYSATSTTTNTIGTGTKTFTIETGKSFVAGQVVIISDSTNVSNYMVGQIDSYVSNTGVLTLTVNSVGGSGSISSWVIAITSMTSSAGMGRLNKTSSYTLTKQDSGFIVDCSGTWTLGFTAAATLGAGWWCYVRNVGTGTITADPNASELIDGVASGPIRPGMTVLVQCDGTEFHCVRVGPQVAMEVLTSGTSWVCPIGVRSFKARVQGAGGSGGCGGAINQAYSSGGAGGYAERIFPISPGVACTYLIGSGGSAVVGAGVNGNDGGSTSITVSGTTVTAGGGGGGQVVGSAASGGTASNGHLNISGLSGYGAGSTVNNIPNFEPPGVLGFYGRGGSGTNNSSFSQPGGQGIIILEY